MKLWQKIYLFSTLLLVLTLNIAGFLLIHKLHNNLITQEVEQNLQQHLLMTSELEFSASLMNRFNLDEPFNLEHSIGSLMTPHYTNTKGRSLYQILDTNHQIIYTDTDFPIPTSQEELLDLSSHKTQYIIRTINQEHYLYIGRLFQLHTTPVILYSATNLTPLYEEKYHYYTFFIKLDLIICCNFAFFMYFISRQITKPIQSLIQSSCHIANGQYTERVQLNSKDEFKTLATQFNLMANTIEDKIKALELSNEAKETFIHNFTHELKTPLTSIIGYANLMRTSKYNEELFTQASHYIYQEGKRLEQLSFKMMDLIYTKSEQTEFVSKDLLVLIENVKSTLEPKLMEHAIHLEIEGTKTILMLDELLMHMLLTNLIENAIKASKPNSVIKVNLSSTEQSAILRITDYGIGIPSHHLEKLHEPFYVVDKSRSRQHNGAGIGLSICYEIIKRHHAKMGIHSQPEQGTTVQIEFPYDFTTI